MTHGRYSDLAGRLVLVTGGATGIGEAHVRAFCANRAKVAFLDIERDAGQALAAELTKGGAAAHFIACDLLDLDALRGAIAEIRAKLGPVHGLVNNAANDQRHDFAHVSAADFERAINVNLRPFVFAAQQVIPHMRELGGGSIVNTTSVAWMRGIKDLELYSAAKAAIVGFTNSLARELGPDRIRVNALAPGQVMTARQRRLYFDAAGEARMLALQCIPDPIEPHDIAEAALFLCSDASRMITKQCITVNAGSL